MQRIRKWLTKIKGRISFWLIKILVRINNDDYPHLYFMGYIAAEYGDKKLMQAVLNTENDLLSYLRIAAQHGQIEIIELLFEKTADINKKDKFAFFYAVENNHPKIVEMLIAAGVDIQADNNYAIRIAAKKQYLEIRDLLIKAGAIL